MKKFALGFILLLALCFVMVSLPEINIVKASGTIYIRADGSVEGTDKIHRDENLYTLTGNISGGIQVQKSYIVIDGAGYTIQGNGEGRGIDLSNNRGSDPSRPEISNVTVKNMQIVSFDRGIENVNTNNNTIIGNYIADCFTGINIGGRPNNVLIKNNTIANNVNGISIAYSEGNQIITENNMINDVVSSNNVIIVWLSPQPTVDRNYWSDYNGTDDDGDGIGDTPYVFINTDYAKYKDYHPLMEPVNTQPVKVVENSWTAKASMPTARAGFGVAVVNGKVYAIGGSDGRWLNTNEEYDPATDTWTTKTPMPTKRGYVAAAVYQNKIYVIGGDSYESSPSGKTEVYDPATDTWETKTSMPTPRVNLCANVVNGKIYLIAGNTFNTLAWPVLSNKTEVYDPSTDSWTTKAAIPNFEGLGVADIASAAVNNKIYVIGGEEWAITDLNQIYDPETDTWSSGTSMPTAVEGPAAGATTGVFAPKRIHVLSMSMHQIYDPETDVWSTGTQMPTPRRHLGVAVINDRLYAIGGGFSGDVGYDVGFVETNENEQYTPFGYEPVPQQSEPFPITWIVAATAIIAVVGAALLVYFAKVKKTTAKLE